MSEASGHPREGLHELLDGRLSPEARAAIERHLGSCQRCREELEVLRSTRAVARRAFEAQPLPPGLATRLWKALDDEDVRRVAPAVTDGSRLLRWALGLASVAVVAAALWMWWPRAGDHPSGAAADFAAVRSGRLEIERRTADAPALEAFFAEREVPVRVLDLGMMGWRLVGGRVHRVGGRPSALYVYEDGSGRRVVCQMYAGRLDDLPVATDVLDHTGITFRVYNRGGVTLAYWQEGATLCVLASDMSREELVALAFAKAMRAQGPEAGLSGFAVAAEPRSFHAVIA